LPVLGSGYGLERSACDKKEAQDESSPHFEDDGLVAVEDDNQVAARRSRRTRRMSAKAAGLWRPGVDLERQSQAVQA
jgi:hypothetical protein